MTLSLLDLKQTSRRLILVNLRVAVPSPFRFFMGEEGGESTVTRRLILAYQIAKVVNMTSN